ncbi:MAG: methylenetetrahydrofolate reductase C-terminal domain-containing protein [Anaerolineae bacterium]|nr:methylenetetrahydrofolate reductase C-terminal domain-containing protein [Anaerolineae bacterium]
MFRWLQNYPHFLEWAYDMTHHALVPFRRWLKPGGGVEKLLVVGEEVGKGEIFNCKMCGQCVLHSTGMTCPMNCPKNLRNGPCGGVRANGHCEVIPEMRCVWVQAWERSQKMPTYGHELHNVLPPLNRQLQGTSAWVNEFTGVAETPPPGWVPVAEIAAGSKK